MLCDINSGGVVVDVLAIPGSLVTSCNTTAGFPDTDGVSAVVDVSTNSAVPVVSVVADTET
jgi:hypothetical protein